MKSAVYISDELPPEVSSQVSWQYTCSFCSLSSNCPLMISWLLMPCKVSLLDDYYLVLIIQVIIVITLASKLYVHFTHRSTDL